MSDNTNKPKQELNPYALVALFAAAGSVMIAFLGFAMLRAFTDAGIWALAAMVAAPAAMGIGIAYFMSKRPPPQ